MFGLQEFSPLHLTWLFQNFGHLSAQHRLDHIAQVANGSLNGQLVFIPTSPHAQEPWNFACENYPDCRSWNLPIQGKLGQTNILYLDVYENLSGVFRSHYRHGVDMDKQVELPRGQDSKSSISSASFLSVRFHYQYHDLWLLFKSATWTSGVYIKEKHSIWISKYWLHYWPTFSERRDSNPWFQNPEVLQNE